MKDDIQREVRIREDLSERFLSPPMPSENGRVCDLRTFMHGAYSQ